MKVSFMTWACPQWDVNQVLTAAVRWGYDGVEPRAEADQRHGIEITTTKKQRQTIRKQFEDMGVEISCIATSRRYAFADEADRRESIELTRKYIELAADLGCPYIRVFGGGTPDGMSREEAQKLVADALAELGPFAAEHNVAVCLETHDDYSLADWAAATVKMAGAPGLGIVWDVMHPYRHGQSMEEAFEAVRELVRHCHVHDAKRPPSGGPAGWELALMGQGDIPHQQAVRLLAEAGFEGHLSGEYINFLPPEELLPHEVQVLREYIAAAR